MLKKKNLLLIFAVLISGLNLLPAQDTKPQSVDNNIRQKVSLDDQRKFDYFFYDMLSSKVTGDYASTYDYLQYCMRIDSTNAAVLYELGNFYNSLQKKEDAYSYYSKAVKYSPDNFYYNMAFAAMSVDQQDFKTAADVYQRLIKENPNKIELYLYLSEVYRMDGDFTRSIESLNDLERTMGMDEKITMQKFKLYSALNDKKKAYEEVQKFIDKNPDDIRYYLLLGNLYLEDGKTKEAYVALTKAKLLDADNPLLITSLANYYEITKNREAADSELRTALFNSKVDVDTKIGILTQYIGILQQNQQSTELANPLLDSLMVEYPQEANFNLLYGNLLMLQEKKQEANFQYRLYAEANPTNPLAWEQLLQSTDMDSIDVLVDVCKSAISYLPEEPLFYFYLSIGQYQKKEYHEALETLDKGILNADPQKNAMLLSELYGQKGSLYHELDMTDSVFVEYDKALEYNPQNLLVLNNYAYYLSIARKDLDKAEKMSSITIKAEPTNPTYLDTYGWVLFEQGAYTMAKIYIEKAVNYSKEKEEDVSAEVLEHYGDVLYKTGEHEKALEYWLQAKEKDSDSKTLDKKIETKEYISE